MIFNNSKLNIFLIIEIIVMLFYVDMIASGNWGDHHQFYEGNRQTAPITVPGNCLKYSRSVSNPALNSVDGNLENGASFFHVIKGDEQNKIWLAQSDTDNLYSARTIYYLNVDHFQLDLIERYVVGDSHTSSFWEHYRPDPRPTKDVDRAFNPFSMYFPSNIIDEIESRNEMKVYISDQQKDMWDYQIQTVSYEGHIIYTNEGLLNYELIIDGYKKIFPSIKIKQFVLVNYNTKRGNVTFKSTRFYYVLNNSIDPLILKMTSEESHSPGFFRDIDQIIQSTTLISVTTGNIKSLPSEFFIKKQAFEKYNCERYALGWIDWNESSMHKILRKYDNKLLFGMINPSFKNKVQITLPALKGTYTVEVFMFLPFYRKDYQTWLKYEKSFDSTFPEIDFPARKYVTPYDILKDQILKLSLYSSDNMFFSKSFTSDQFSEYTLEASPNNQAAIECLTIAGQPDRIYQQYIEVPATIAKMTLKIEHNFNVYSPRLGGMLVQTFMGVRLWYDGQIDDACSELGYAYSVAKDNGNTTEINVLIDSILKHLKSINNEAYQRCYDEIYK